MPIERGGERENVTSRPVMHRSMATKVKEEDGREKINSVISTFRREKSKS